MAFDLSTVLEKHVDVPGLSIGLIKDYDTIGVSSGLARSSIKEILTNNHFLECASLSKTVASVFAFEYLNNIGIRTDESVNSVLERFHSDWRIRISPQLNLPASAADELKLFMLMNHTGLGMHYVNGIPLSHAFPSMYDLISGKHQEDYKYQPIFLEKVPGSRFSYAGGGYLTLQYILELISGKTIQELILPFLRSLNIENEFTFDVYDQLDKKYAYGHYHQFAEVQPNDGGRLAFPPLAAGGLCTNIGFAKFLAHFSFAYNNEKGSGGISHATAKAILSPSSLVDLGAVQFIGAKSGCGVFVAESGPNRVMIHQAANDGFRGLYVMCFDGPDHGNGCVIIANGDNPAIGALADAAKIVLGPEGLNIRGLDFSRVEGAQFSRAGLTQAELINQGLKALLFDAFVPASEYTEPSSSTCTVSTSGRGGDREDWNRSRL